MPSYGSYETTREIASGHGSVVYSARKAGESKDNYAVKVFALEPFIDDQDARQELDQLVDQFNQTFTRSIEIQKRAAQSSRNVAPVFEVGREMRGGWYATRLYPRSVQKILDGRIALNREWFHHIIASMTRGALDLKRICGRSHGEIQPSNILIGAAEKVREAEVVLSDPLPGETAEAARFEIADLHAIGKIIFELVRRREIEDASEHSILPLLPSAEWTSIFGKNTEGWLSLCNRLLDPNLSLDSYNLEKLEADLGRLQPKPPVTGKVLTLAAVGVALLGVGAFYFIRSAGRGTLVVTTDPPSGRIQVKPEGGPLIPLPPGGDGKQVRLTLAKGPYLVSVEYPGLGFQERAVEVKGRQETTEAFVFEYGTVSLSSQPQGASIRVDGTNWVTASGPAMTPATLVTKPGTLTFQVDLKGYLPTNFPVTVASGKTITLSAPLSQPPAGQVLVELDSSPRGVEIEVNGKPFARTLETKSLPPGTYNVVGRFREIWPAKQTNLVVREGTEAKVFFYFERARLNLESEPPGVQVFANNRLIGVTPTNLLWPTGAVTFQFQKVGYEPARVSTNIYLDNDRVELIQKMVSTNGIIALAVGPVAATATDLATGERFQVSPGKSVEITNLPGPRVFLIEAPGYIPSTNRIDFVSKQKIAKSVTLIAEPLAVTFTSAPPGAELFDASNNGSLGAPESIRRMAAGSYRLAARHTRHPRLGWITNDVVVATNRPNTHVFEFPMATLTITSSPPRVEVFDRSFKDRRDSLGRTPIGLVVRTGAVTLEFISTNGVDVNTTTFDIVAPGATNIGTYFRPPKPPAYANSVGMVLEFIPLEGTNGGYWVGKFEVTQQQYQDIMNANPSAFKGSDPVKQPVESVGFDDARSFCQQLTARDQASLKAQTMEGWTYALPTPAQWFYYVTGTALEDAVTSAAGDVKQPKPVGSSKENKQGLFDVRGNVWEWCADGALRGAAYNTTRGFTRQLELNSVLRLDVNMRSAANAGFRCVLMPPPGQTAQR